MTYSSTRFILKHDPNSCLLFIYIFLENDPKINLTFIISALWCSSHHIGTYGKMWGTNMMLHHMLAAECAPLKLFPSCHVAHHRWVGLHCRIKGKPYWDLVNHFMSNSHVILQLCRIHSFFPEENHSAMKVFLSRCEIKKYKVFYL